MIKIPQLVLTYNQIKHIHYLETSFVYDARMPEIVINITNEVFQIRPTHDVYYVINSQMPVFLPLEFKFSIEVPEYISKLGLRFLISVKFKWNADAKFGHLVLSAEEENLTMFHFFEMPVINLNSVYNIDSIADYIYSNQIPNDTLERIKGIIEDKLRFRQIVIPNKNWLLL